MSPTSTARNSSTLRKIALCGAALVVTLLPTACGAAYADTGHAGHAAQVVEVGGADAAEPNSDEEGAAAEEGGDQNADQEQNADDQNADAGGEEAGGENEQAQEGDAAQDPAADPTKDPAQEAARQGGNDGQNAEDKGKGKGNGQGAENGQGGGKGIEDNNGLDVLGRDCSNSKLEPHTGFQVAPACVDTAFGEVASEDKSPSLLITEAPQTVKVGEDFSITVSTRNLIRDRFLGAAAGGYYLESSFLNEDGLQRGHFHTACRVLESTNEAPDASPDPEFFVATQDNGGGAAPDQVKIDVTGIDKPGTIQCSSWAGDGSHRIPMMQRANQTPAFDSVRITVQ